MHIAIQLHIATAKKISDEPDFGSWSNYNNQFVQINLTIASWLVAIAQI